MNDFDRLFRINSQCRALVCVTCQYAVVPTQLNKHLRAHHRRLSLQQRRDIILRVEELSELAQVPFDVVYPSPSDPPITGLPVYYAVMLPRNASNSRKTPRSLMLHTRDASHSRMRTLGAVAADPRRAAFQQSQVYIKATIGCL